MGKDIEFLLKMAADSEELSKDDRLSKLIEENAAEDSDELSELELDNVRAAVKPDLGKFYKYKKP